MENLKLHKQVNNYLILDEILEINSIVLKSCFKIRF